MKIVDATVEEATLRVKYAAAHKLLFCPAVKKKKKTEERLEKSRATDRGKYLHLVSAASARRAQVQ